MPCAAMGSVLNSRTMALTAACTWAGEPRPAVSASVAGSVSRIARASSTIACSAVEAPGSRAWSVAMAFVRVMSPPAISALISSSTAD